MTDADKHYLKYTRIRRDEWQDISCYRLYFLVSTPDGHHQEFEINMGLAVEHDKERIEWMQAMLCKAIRRLVEAEANK